MAKIIKKILVEFAEGFFDPKRVLSIAKENNQRCDRSLYYSAKLWGKRETHRTAIKKDEYDRLLNLAIKSKTIYSE